MVERGRPQFLNSLKNRLLPLVYDTVNSKVRLYLRVQNAEKLARFTVASARFKEVLADISRFDPSRLLTDEWATYSQKIYTELGDRPAANFLRLPTLEATMASVPYPGRLLQGVTKTIDSFEPESPIRAALREDSVGDPIIVNRRYQTSFPRLQHLTHILSHANATGSMIGRDEVIMEWGGGYGDFARVWYQLTRAKGTFVIVDVPLMLSLQWTYLSSVLGADRIHIVRDADPDAIKQDSVNLFPVSDSVSQIQFDTFVSNWAISESSGEAQRLVWRNPSLHSSRLLISYSTSDPLCEMLHKEGATLLPIGYHRNQFYLFR